MVSDTFIVLINASKESFVFISIAYCLKTIGFADWVVVVGIEVCGGDLSTSSNVIKQKWNNEQKNYRNIDKSLII